MKSPNLKITSWDFYIKIKLFFIQAALISIDSRTLHFNLPDMVSTTTVVSASSETFREDFL
jgi:hypothetical protein